MATISKTVGTSLISLQSLAANSVVISSTIDVSTKFAATIFMHFGRRATTALTEGAELRIEASAKSSGEGFWFPLSKFKTTVIASESEALTGTISAAATVLTLASTTNLAAGDKIYIDNGTIANSEWARIKAISANTSVTIEDALVNAQTGSTIYDQAEMFVAQVDLTAISRLRLVIDGSNTGQAVAVEAHIIVADSIG
tara:strand:+ start:2395 stop:2991 length:597 start_codon:yes stop_codon:yes gene_type:complete